MGWVVKATPRPLYPRERPSTHCTGGTQGRSGWVQKISPPTGIRSPDRPSRSESLYRLSYPGPLLSLRINNFFTITNFNWPHIQYLVCVLFLWKDNSPSHVFVCWFGGGSPWRQWHHFTHNVLALLVSSSHRTKLIVTADLVPSGIIWFTNTACGLAVTDLMQKRFSALARLAEYTLSQISHEIFFFPLNFSVETKVSDNFASEYLV
jgi:hypothetical protein